MRGKEVADLSVVTTSKGDALRELRARLDSGAVLYIGDDISDELALATLGEGDLGIKVAPGAAGEGPGSGAPDAAIGAGAAGGHLGTGEASGRPDTHARFTISDPETVALILTSIFELRRAWLFGKNAVPIERHTMLANGQSTALVDPAGRICWMPHPLPHSASMFSEILGSDAAGYYSVGLASGAKPLTQRYQEHSTLVETRWAGLTARDYLAPVPEDSQDTVLVRALTGDAEAVSYTHLTLPTILLV